MNVRWIAGLAVISACGSAGWPTTDRHPIRWERSGRSGTYYKDDVALTGWTCGDRYARAVSGVPEAEARIGACARDELSFVGLMGGFIAGGAGALGLEATGHPTAARAVGLTAGITFVVGLYEAFRAREELGEAIRIYNASLPAP